MRLPALLFLAALAPAAAGGAERINQEGRILGPAPIVTTPTLFDTAAADAIVSAMQIFPLDNAWNEDISSRPLLSNSAAMIAQIKSSLSSSRQTLRAFFEMNYVLVPDNQPPVPIDFFNYPDESDPSPYPLPADLPIPGAVTFANPAQAATSATFSTPGAYTLMLNASDGVHAVARDAVTIEVVLPVAISRLGSEVQISFPTLVGQTYSVESTTALAAGTWTVLAGNLAGTGNPIAVTDASAGSNSQVFYRVAVLPETSGALLRPARTRGSR